MFWYQKEKCNPPETILVAPPGGYALVTRLQQGKTALITNKDSSKWMKAARDNLSRPGWCPGIPRPEKVLRGAGEKHAGAHGGRGPGHQRGCGGLDFHLSLILCIKLLHDLFYPLMRNERFTDEQKAYARERGLIEG